MLNQANQKDIRELINSDAPDLEGKRVKAIYRMIQIKGRGIASNDTRFHNIKAFEFALGEFVAIKRFGNEANFFPCTLKTIHFKKQL